MSASTRMIRSRVPAAVIALAAITAKHDWSTNGQRRAWLECQDSRLASPILRRHAAGDEAQRRMALNRLAGAHLVVPPAEALFQLPICALQGKPHGVGVGGGDWFQYTWVRDLAPGIGIARDTKSSYESRAAGEQVWTDINLELYSYSDAHSPPTC